MLVGVFGSWESLAWVWSFLCLSFVRLPVYLAIIIRKQ